MVWYGLVDWYFFAVALHNMLVSSILHKIQSQCLGTNLDDKTTEIDKIFFTGFEEHDS